MARYRSRSYSTGIAGICWRVSHKRLILFTDWVSRPVHSPDQAEPHPPCMTIRLSRSGFQPSDARKSRCVRWRASHLRRRCDASGGCRATYRDRTAAGGLIADPRNPLLVTHSVVDILRARMLAIACGYEDADDLDHLRSDPGFKLACGRLPDTGDDLCSQPTARGHNLITGIAWTALFTAFPSRLQRFPPRTKLDRPPVGFCLEGPDAHAAAFAADRPFGW